MATQVDRVYRLELMHNGNVGICPDCTKIKGLPSTHPLIKSVGCSCSCRSNASTSILTGTDIITAQPDYNFLGMMAGGGVPAPPTVVVEKEAKKDTRQATRFASYNVPSQIPRTPLINVSPTPAPVPIKVEVPRPLPAPTPGVTDRNELAKAKFDLKNANEEKNRTQLKLNTFVRNAQIQADKLAALEKEKESLELEINSLSTQLTDLKNVSVENNSEQIVKLNEQIREKDMAIRTLLKTEQKLNGDLVDQTDKAKQLQKLVDNLTETKNALLVQIGTVQKQNDTLFTEQANDRNLLDTKSKLLNAANLKSTQLAGQVALLKENISEQEQTIAQIPDLRAQIGALQMSKGSVDEQIQDRNEELGKMRRQKEALEKQYSESSQLVDDLKNRVAGLETEREQEQGMQNAVEGSKIKQLNARIESMSVELDNANRELAAARTVFDQKELEIQTLRNQPKQTIVQYQGGQQEDQMIVNLLANLNTNAIVNGLNDGSIQPAALVYTVDQYADTNKYTVDVPESILDMSVTSQPSMDGIVSTLLSAESAYQFSITPFDYLRETIESASTEDIIDDMLKYVSTKRAIRKLMVFTDNLLANGAVPLYVTEYFNSQVSVMAACVHVYEYNKASALDNLEANLSLQRELQEDNQSGGILDGLAVDDSTSQGAFSRVTSMLGSFLGGGKPQTLQLEPPPFTIDPNVSVVDQFLKRFKTVIPDDYPAVETKQWAVALDVTTPESNVEVKELIKLLNVLRDDLAPWYPGQKRKLPATNQLREYKSAEAIIQVFSIEKIGVAIQLAKDLGLKDLRGEKRIKPIQDALIEAWRKTQ